MLKNIGSYIIFFAIAAITAYLVNEYLVFQLALLALAWCILFGFEYAMNGGSIFRCLLEDFSLYGFNGQQRRAEFAKKQLNPNHDITICGSKRVWKSRAAYSKAQYIECGNDILGRGYYFWLSKIIIPLAIAIYLIIK